MKHIYRIALAFLVTVGMAQADPLFGIWQSTADDNGNFGHIEMQDCDGKICGTLIKSFGPSGKQISSENVGKLIVWDMKSKGNGKYGYGKIWTPDRDKTYASKLVLSGDQLRVSGCILILCREGGIWQRVK